MNRFYLLLSLFIAFVLPAINIPLQNTTAAVTSGMIELPEILAGTGTMTYTSYSLSWLHLLLIIYLSGVCFFFIRMIFSISKIFSVAKIFKQQNGAVKIFAVEELPSFSFLNFIFINDKDIKEEIQQQVICHEMVHVKQMHSLDLLIAEVIHALLWFNPVMYLYKKDIKMVHEYIADKEAMATTGTDNIEYGKLLLNQLLTGKQLQMAHLFSNEHIKNRIIMLSKKTTSAKLKASYLMVIPLFALAVFLFSCENTMEKKIEPAQAEKTIVDEKIYENAEQMPQFPGGKEAMMAYMGNNIKYPEDAKSEKVEGTVFTKFVISKDGKVEGVEVVKGVNESLNAEAVRVVKEMPDWTPAYNEGNPVKVAFTLPVKFKLN